nr:hypothetical protein [Tanacetum cinerariifolium]
MHPGATSGIGAETARVLALRGVHVIMAVRNANKGIEVKDSILTKTPDAKIDVLELYLSSLASVRAFAANYLSLDLPLHILINNAGVLSPPFKLSKDKSELHFATNHLGHFLLTNLLLGKMKITSSEQKTEGRIINVSSGSHRFVRKSSGIFSDKINDESRLRGSTSLQILCAPDSLSLTFSAAIIFSRGAATTCYLALNPKVKGVMGKYFSDSNLAEPSTIAKDQDLAKELWGFSLGLSSSK